MWSRFSIRNIEFYHLFEDFLISAVVAILGIRIFLQLTGYPQLGGEGLHISHMLWGGLLMFISIALLLTYLSTGIKRIAAIVGGVGFGTFIDELGKFITSDNDYFYQPTFALIYVLFVLLYVLFRTYGKYRTFTQKEYLVNSLELTKDAIILDLDTDEKDRAVGYLTKANQNDPITKTMTGLYHELDAIAPGPPFPLSLLYRKVQALYFELVRHTWFDEFLIIFFIGKSILAVVDAAFLLMSISFVFLQIPLPQQFQNRSLAEFAYLLSVVVAGVFVWAGVVKLRSSRIVGFRLFKRSVLLSILLVAVFQFYQSPGVAFLGLIVNILILLSLNFMIEQEVTRST